VRSDGTPEEVEEEIGRMSEVLRHAGATAITVSNSEEERLRFWSGRKNAFPAAAASAPTTCAWTPPSAQAPGRHPAGDPGDGEEVPAALRQRVPRRRRQPAPADPVRCQRPDELHRCELFGADILETSVAMGGTVTGEHGVGVEKLNSMCTQFTTEENRRCSR
jgi:glycolate oxidase